MSFPAPVILGFWDSVTPRPHISFPRSAVKSELVPFAPFLRNTSFIIKKKFKITGSKLNVYLIIGQELAPVEMLAKGTAVQLSPFQEGARKPRGRWQLLNNG